MRTRLLLFTFILFSQLVTSQNGCEFNLRQTYELANKIDEDGNSIPDVSSSWSSVGSLSGNNPFSFLNFQILVKAGSGVGKVRYKLQVQNNSNFKIKLSVRWDNEGSDSRISIPSGGSSSVECLLAYGHELPSVKISSVNFSFTENERNNYGVYASNNLLCSDSEQSVIAELEQYNESSNTKGTSNNESSTTSDSDVNSQNTNDDEKSQSGSDKKSDSNSNESGDASSSQFQSNKNQENTSNKTEEEKMLEEEYSPEAIEKKNKEREAEAERRRIAKEKENEQIAANSAAMGTLMMALGAVIYKDYGKMGNVYTGSNFLYGVESGFGVTVDDEHGFTVDLNLKGKFGYEKLINFRSTSLIKGLEFGAHLTPNVTLGMLPLLNLPWQTSYGLGGRFSVGLPSVKFFYDYERGKRTFGDLDEVENIVNRYKSKKYGLKFSIYNDSKILRNHFFIGVIREKVSGYNEFNNFSIVPVPLVYKGYMFEWYKEHHGRLFIHYIPRYKSSLSTIPQENEGMFLKVGFLRTWETFESTRSKKSREKLRSSKEAIKKSRSMQDADFIMYTYDKQNYLGLSFGGLKKSRAAFYSNIKALTRVKVDHESNYGNNEINNEGESTSFHHFTTTGKSENLVLFAVSAGATFKLKYPLFGYAGVGLAFVEHFEQVRRYESNYWEPFDGSSPSELVWYQNKDIGGVKLFPEIGVKLKIKNRLILKYGLNYRKGLFQQFGIGIAFY